MSIGGVTYIIVQNYTPEEAEMLENFFRYSISPAGTVAESSSLGILLGRLASDLEVKREVA